MTSNRWQQAKEIFHAALDRAPGERSAFLAKACGGDESMRREVESLIASHEKEGSFIDSPAYEAAAEILTTGKDPIVGEMVGKYEILSPLGKGGMGEVYLARDTELPRHVALKFLSAELTDDPDRLRRFEQEAWAASALNQPNILTILQVGQNNGRRFIAAEFVDGETLRNRIETARLNISETLSIAEQVALALVAAHARGIVHRDIKPENVMIRRDGLVKVLDFGLAKLTKPQGSSAEDSTRAMVQTGTGLVIGTISYMSPEQARGVVVDARSDIFSLGVVIYEMIADVKPFTGDTPNEVLADVLKTEPPRLSLLNSAVPPELERIVKKALRKDPDERYQGVKDLLLDLRSLKEDLNFKARLDHSFGKEEPSAPVSHVIPQTYPANPTSEIKVAVSTIGRTLSGEIRRHKVAATLLLVSLLVVIIGGTVWTKKLLGRGAKSLPFQSMRITRLTSHGKAIHAALSPDGKYFVYVLSDGNQSLWLRQVSAANDTQIVPPAPVDYFGVTFSPDGTSLYYVTKAKAPNALFPGVLFRVPVLGGAPVKLLETIDTPVSFSSDGKRFAFVRRDFPNPGDSGLFIANADGSGERQIAARKAPEIFADGFAGPSWAKDDHLVACPVTNLESGSQLVAVNVGTGSQQVLTRERWHFIGRVEWLTDMSGLLIVATEQTSDRSQIFFVSYPGGQIRKITNDLDSYRGLSRSADFSALATIQVGLPAKIWTSSEVSFSRPFEIPTGNVGFVGGGLDSIASAPQNRVVYVSTAGENPQIWIVDPNGSNRRQLTSDAANLMPAVSGDGRYIVFISSRSGAQNIWRMDLDGNNPRRLTSGVAEFKPTVSPDGRWVVYTSLIDGQLSLRKVSIDGGAPVLLAKKQVRAPAVSPDGKFIAYLYADHFSDEAPTNLAIMPFDGGELTKTFAVVGGNLVSSVRWARDGQSLYLSLSTNGVMNIWEQRLAGGPPKQLTNFTENYLAGFDLSSDARSFVCERGVSVRDAVLITDVSKQ